MPYNYNLATTYRASLRGYHVGVKTNTFLSHLESTGRVSLAEVKKTISNWQTVSANSGCLLFTSQRHLGKEFAGLNKNDAFRTFCQYICFASPIYALTSSQVPFSPPLLQISDDPGFKQITGFAIPRPVEFVAETVTYSLGQRETADFLGEKLLPFAGKIVVVDPLSLQKKQLLNTILVLSRLLATA
ncbi:MAG: hypothetical protein WCW67_08020 [Candidatus Margulisiibacteriota bacterium]|jgi:hypothetical protein